MTIQKLGFRSQPVIYCVTFGPSALDVQLMSAKPDRMFQHRFSRYGLWHTGHSVGFHRGTLDYAALIAPVLLTVGRPLLAVSPGCALRLFSGALTDLVAEVRNLVGDVGSRFFTAGRCD